MGLRIIRKVKLFACKLLLGAALLFGALALLAMAQGALAFLPGLGLLLADLLALNTLCGLLLPAQPTRLRVKARSRRVQPALYRAPALRVARGGNGGRVA